VAGALKENDYIETIRLAGFAQIEIKKHKVIVLPDELLGTYLDRNDLKRYRSGNFGLFSITVVGHKS